MNLFCFSCYSCTPSSNLQNPAPVSCTFLQLLHQCRYPVLSPSGLVAHPLHYRSVHPLPTYKPLHLSKYKLVHAQLHLPCRYSSKWKPLMQCSLYRVLWTVAVPLSPLTFLYRLWKMRSCQLTDWAKWKDLNHLRERKGPHIMPLRKDTDSASMTKS